MPTRCTPFFFLTLFLLSTRKFVRARWPRRRGHFSALVC